MTSDVRVKFCGLRQTTDVEAALRLGADFLGFVFAASSPRALDLEQAAKLLEDRETRPARRVGVFQDQALETVRDAVERCRLDLVQLHGREPVAFAEQLAVPVITVVRTRVPEALPDNLFALLVDAQDESGRSGGLGRLVDDDTLDRLRDTVPAGVPWILSGGLTPENVSARARRHGPWAVDVSSGIESAPGVKDAQRMRDFMRAVEGLGRADSNEESS